MPYYDQFDYNYGYAQPYNSAAGIIGGFFVGLMSLILFYFIIAWIFRSIGLYHMAKNRGIQHAWFAWIPFLSEYILGRLINDKVVLGDNIVTKHASFFLPLLAFLTSSVTTDMDDVSWIWAIFTMLVWVYTTSALWRLFKIYRPKSRCSFTIWSIILTSGFFIFAIRNDKPFDELEPNKVYENYYGGKAVIDQEYSQERAQIREQERQREEALRDVYHDQLNQENLTTAQKDELREEYYENRHEIKKEADNLIKAENREYQEEIETLDNEIKEDLDPLVTVNDGVVTIEPEQNTNEDVIILPQETETIDIQESTEIPPEIDDQINETISAIGELIDNQNNEQE